MRIIFQNDPTVIAKMGCVEQIKCLDILCVRELIIFHSTSKLFPSHAYIKPVIQMKFIQPIITTKMLTLH